MGATTNSMKLIWEAAREVRVRSHMGLRGWGRPVLG